MIFHVCERPAQTVKQTGDGRMILLAPRHAFREEHLWDEFDGGRDLLAIL